MHDSLEAKVGAALAAWPDGPLDRLEAAREALPGASQSCSSTSASRGCWADREIRWRRGARCSMPEPDTPVRRRGREPPRIPELPRGLPAFILVASARRPRSRAFRRRASSRRSGSRRAGVAGLREALYGVGLQRCGRPRLGSAERSTRQRGADRHDVAGAGRPALSASLDKDAPERAFGRLGPLVGHVPERADGALPPWRTALSGRAHPGRRSGSSAPAAARGRDHRSPRGRSLPRDRSAKGALRERRSFDDGRSCNYRVTADEDRGRSGAEETQGATTERPDRGDPRERRGPAPARERLSHAASSMPSELALALDELDLDAGSARRLLRGARGGCRSTVVRRRRGRRQRA